MDPTDPSIYIEDTQTLSELGQESVRWCRV